MNASAQSEAIVQLARKRRVLDHAGAARLQVLMQIAGVESVDDARSFLSGAGLLPPPVARRLQQALPEPEQASFGTYRPLVHLADGGMGSAWLAAADNELVVVKTMRGSLAGNEEVCKRFEREVRIMRQLTHPNVVHCLDSGSTPDGSLYMVLEFVDGGDLKDLLEEKGTLPEALGLAVAWQVADALVAAEAHELVHRDIKPANIFTSDDGRAKLADFGIARSTAIERTQLTMQGAVVGSPYYMSPEQVRADPHLGVGCDIYAVGAVIFTALAGTEPYRGALQDVLHQHCTAPVPDIRELRPQIGHTTASIITRCMQKDVAERFPDARALRDALGEGLAALERHDGVPVAVRPAARAEATLATEVSSVSATQATMAMDLAGDSVLTTLGDDGGATIAADLSGENGEGGDETMAADSSNQATVAADLCSNETMAADLSGDETYATAVAGGETLSTKVMRNVGGDALAGDFSRALATRWITLTGPGTRLVLVGKRILVAGKLCEPPVDLCLRCYPTASERETCLRISRQHWRLEFTEHVGVQVTDLGSGNGSHLDGAALAANQAVTLGERHQLRVAGVLDLDLHVVPRSGTETWTLDGAPPSTGGHGCGIEIGHTVDAVALRRSGNEPGMGYAMVLRRVRIGGPNADLVVPGCDPTVAMEVGLYDGRWIVRDGRSEAWRPLVAGSTIDCGGVPLVPSKGDYAVFA
ncbi:MAG: protein kinase [Planctomycetota bacterium]|jgi:hypothetical protein|nr:protein kinase [Planctomycetota bacterium]